LPKVLRNHPELRDVNRMTLLESLRVIRLSLWDPKEHRMISFRAFNMAK